MNLRRRPAESTATSPATESGVPEHPLRDFVVWAARRSRSRPLPHRLKDDSVGIDDDSHWELLQQCLTDTEPPLEVRAAGPVLLLFGQHHTRVAALPTTALRAVDGDMVLVLDRTPIRLPKPLARLLAELADRPPHSGWAAN
ncbi:hypothetical protein FKN01_27700 [Streptomyces sp. 130]|uniref:hypothetical protein n=1 Tax=Streptomyces sp. 130 TaxID=2591006 RepID=UPI00117DBE37|nr:hypothetical protein [Streptomyces sp. 130]TRV73343.1 hypothetical protein FKN01_27700 [Streptomyces sp. 130]